MKVKYIDYSKKELKEFECVQVIFTLDEENIICFKNANDPLNDALKILKRDVQTIEEY